MTADQITPALKSANLGSMVGMFREILNSFLKNVDDMLPAQIISYDRATHRAQVQPMIMLINTNNTVVSRAPVASVPVLQLGGGGFVLDFPLNPGDLGFIKANDRDISLFMQMLKETKPNTFRKHTFEDAIFIPATLAGYTIDEEDAAAVVLQTLDGSQKISIMPDKIKITASTEIILDAPLVTVTGDIVSGTISLQNHVHGGVTTGSGNTDIPS